MVLLTVPEAVLCHSIARGRSAGQSMDLTLPEAVLCLNEAGSSWVVSPLFCSSLFQGQSGASTLEAGGLEREEGELGVHIVLPGNTKHKCE